MTSSGHAPLPPARMTWQSSFPLQRRGFFFLAALLLLARPLAVWTGIFSWEVPGWYETILTPLLIALSLTLAASRNGFVAVFLTAIILLCAEQSLPLLPSTRFLVLWFMVEWLAVDLRPFIRAIAFLLVSPSLSHLVGEPLPLAFTAIAMAIFMKASWHAVHVRFSNGEEDAEAALTLRPGQDVLIGFFLGLALSLFPAGVPTTEPPHRPVIFDEAHGSSERSLPEAPSLNGHQDLFASLRGASHQRSALGQGLPPQAIVVSILPTQPFSPEELESLYLHVRNGGSFLGIIDHSDMEGASSRFAPLFSRFGILAGHDTVAWPGGGIPGTGISSAIGNIPGRPRTGASLQHPRFWWPWYLSSTGPHPLVWSEVSGGGGATWLGAWGRSGSGTWAILGDSSWFRNGQIAQNAEMARHLFRLLQAPPRAFPYPGLIALTAFLFPFFLWKIARSRRGHPVLVFFFLLGTTLGAIWVRPAPLEGDLFTRMGPEAHIVVSPGSRSGSTSDRPRSFPDNLDTFLEEIWTAGWTPRLIDVTSISGNAPVWILPPHDAPLPRGFCHRIREQVEQGARLLLIGDPDHPPANRLLEEFGFALASQSLVWGQFATNSLDLPDHRIPEPAPIYPTAHPFLGSWTAPLWSDCPTPLFGGEPLFRRADGQTVVSRRKIRNGAVMAISDPTFFSNQAFEIRGRLDSSAKRRFVRYLFTLLKQEAKS